MEAVGWRPHLNNLYKGWHSRGSNGIIVIHVGGDEFNGTFTVGTTTATIYYKDGFEDKLVKVPKELCKFAKHFSHRTRYYHIWLDKNMANQYQQRNVNGEPITKIPSYAISNRDNMDDKIAL